MGYFQNNYASNSDIKEVVARHEGRTKPDNIHEIYNFGTAFHAGILEPHKVDQSAISVDQVDLLKVMSSTFWKDKMCRDIVLQYDFRREYEFYRQCRYGIQTRCKVDGDSRSLGVILELKGLGVTTESAFHNAIMQFDYDQGAAWYLNTATGYVKYKYKLIVGISKKYPDRLFKVLIDRDHKYYNSGDQKAIRGVKIWKHYGFE